MRALADNLAWLWQHRETSRVLIWLEGVTVLRQRYVSIEWHPLGPEPDITAEADTIEEAVALLRRLVEERDASSPVRPTLALAQEVAQDAPGGASGRGGQGAAAAPAVHLGGPGG